MKVDYLISGAGGTGLSFLDVILTETDATVAIVDRRDAPGGHWNDAYPFVRLHQSGAFYGVVSRNLGAPRRAERGLNAGLSELSTRSEILHYFHDLMENTYLPSGRVTYLPMSEHVGGGEVRALVGGQTTQFEIGRKLVNAGFWGDLTSIPGTHDRPFAVAEGVECVAPNDLPRRAPGHRDFTVIGAGKTAMDSVLWLLDRGVAPARIAWVRPNDYWLFQREKILYHPDFFFTTIAAFQAELAALGTARTVDEYCRKMEASGMWHRIDPAVWPTRFHAAICSTAEVDALRRVTNVIRAGHVTRIEPDRLILQEGEVATAPDCLFIDCTGRGGAILPPDAPPVFDGDTINVFMVRPFQPLFSAALIAFLEANVPDDAVRRACTRITNFHDTPAQYLAVALTALQNQRAWGQVPALRPWLDGCRLNAINHLLVGLGPEDTERIALLGKFRGLNQAAAENIPAILARKPA